MKPKFILLLFCCAFLWSCSEIDSEITPKPTDSVEDFQNIRVRQGVLSFNNPKEFQAFYNFILDNQMDVDFLLKFIKENYDFVSAREIFENHSNNIEHPSDIYKAVESNPAVFEKVYIGDEYYFDLAFSNISSYFLNKEGKVILGDTLVMVREEGTYLFAIDAEREFDKIGLKSGNFRFVPKQNENNHLKSQFSYRTAYFMNTRRIVARLYLHEIFYPGIGIIYEYDARTTAQSRELGIWIQNRIDLIGFKHGFGTITHQFSGVTQVAPWDYFLSNRADLSLTLAYGTYIDPIVHSQSTLLLTHYGIWNARWGYREIANNELFQ